VSPKKCGSWYANLSCQSVEGLNFCQLWGEAYGKGKVTTAHAFTTSSHAIEQQFIISDGLLGSHHLTHTIHGLQSVRVDASIFSLPSAKEHPLFYVGVYSALGLGSAFLGVLAAIVQYTGALRASKVLFKQLLISVVRAPMRWHDTTPQGAFIRISIYQYIHTYLTRSHAQSFQQGEESDLELCTLEMT